MRDERERRECSAENEVAFYLRVSVENEHRICFSLWNGIRRVDSAGERLQLRSSREGEGKRGEPSQIATRRSPLGFLFQQIKAAVDLFRTAISERDNQAKIQYIKTERERDETRRLKKDEKSSYTKKQGTNKDSGINEYNDAKEDSGTQK